MSGMPASATLETVKRILVQVKSLPEPWTALADDADLVEGVGLDSIELLNFMLEIEAQLGIRIDFDRMEFSTLRSLTTLAAFLDGMPKAESAA
jgi:acyl carrier protein